MKARTIVRPLAGALLILAVMLALPIAALLFEPQRILTAKTVGRALQVAGRAYRPRWSRLDFEIRSPDVFEKDVSFSAADFCFSKTDGSAAGCFKSLAARFTVELAPTGVRVTKLDLLEAEGGKLRFDTTKSASKPAAKSGFDPYRLPRLLPAAVSGVKIGKLTVDIASVELAGSSGTTRGTFRLGFDSARPGPLALDARWEERGGFSVHRGRARLAVESDFLKNGRLTYADAKGSLDAEGVRAEFTAKARQAGAEAVSLRTEASGRREGLRFHFRGQGVQTPARYAMNGSLDVFSSSGPLKSLSLAPFRFTASRKKGAAFPSSLRLDGGLKAEPIGLRPVRGFTPPPFIAGRLVLNERATPTAFQKDHFDADLSIALNPYLSWYEAHADLFAKASGRTSELSRMKIRQRIDANVTVARFEDLVAFLAGGAYAVPAPFDALKGGLQASFGDRGDPRTDRIDFDYQARGDLSGERQKLKFHVAGGGSAVHPAADDRSVRARATVTLDDVAIQLPHLDALKMPKVTLDSRIKNAGSKESVGAAEKPRRRSEVSSSTSSVALDLRVVTGKPVVLYSDLAKTPVPVALDLKLAASSGPVTGAVEVKSFDVEFFRRDAKVDHLTLTFAPGSKTVALDGLIKYKATEAMISIRLLGTADKPQVVFESDPPLSQSDIVAMLLFGKSPDDLDADQATTVANSQTAMSDEAFGLASLYLFASTPIQFVGYDPATKSYTMKFRIPGGETLSLNSDFDTSKSVQLRRRLSRHFAVVAEAVNSPTQGNGVVTLLEWFTRY